MSSSSAPSPRHAVVRETNVRLRALGIRCDQVLERGKCVGLNIDTDADALPHHHPLVSHPSWAAHGLMLVTGITREELQQSVHLVPHLIYVDNLDTENDAHLIMPRQPVPVAYIAEGPRPALASYAERFPPPDPGASWCHVIRFADHARILYAMDAWLDLFPSTAILYLVLQTLPLSVAYVPRYAELDWNAAVAEEHVRDEAPSA